MIMSFLALLIECILFSTFSELNNFDSSINEALGIIIVILNVIVVVTIGIYKSSKGDKNIAKILLLSFALRMTLLLIDIYGRSIFILPGSGNDTEMFHGGALTYPGFEFEKNPYAFFVGVIYSMCMKQRIVAQYVNLLLSMSVISIIIKICDEFNISYKVKVFITSIIAFIPNYMILSVILLRESVMIFLVTCSLWMFIRWWKYNDIIGFILSILLVLCSAIFHSGVIANAVGYILIFILFNNRERKLKFTIKSTILCVLFTVMISIFLSDESNIFMQKFGNIDDVQDITYRAEVSESGGAAYQTTVESNSFASLLINSPQRMFYFITSPLPWNWRGLNDIIAFIFSAMFYIISYIYAIKVIRIKSDTVNIIKAFLIISLAGAFVFAWGTSNAGTAMRHRDKFISNYVVMLALSLNLINKSKLIKLKENYSE